MYQHSSSTCIRTIYIFQMIRYFRVCGSNQDCLDGGLTTKKEDTEPIIQVKVEVATMNWLTVTGISVLQMTMDMFCMPLFHLSWLITWFVTRETKRVQLLTLLEHLHSPPILVGFVFLNLYIDLLRPLFIYSSFFCLTMCCPAVIDLPPLITLFFGDTFKLYLKYLYFTCTYFS